MFSALHRRHAAVPSSNESTCKRLANEINQEKKALPQGSFAFSPVVRRASIVSPFLYLRAHSNKVPSCNVTATNYKLVETVLRQCADKKEKECI